MKRTGIDMEDVASFQNLCLAAVNAGKGKRGRRVVKKFFGDFIENITFLREELLFNTVPVGKYKIFTVYDPKRREIYAPCFRDRIIHHAVVNKIGPVIDTALVATTFACREGMGPLKAVGWAQKCSRKYPWFVKIDIRKYFDSVDHGILKTFIERKIKGRLILDLLEKIIGSYHTIPGKGIPIGALTSQYFANFYLNNVDRFIMDQKEISAHVRYMDDIVWWCKDKSSAKNTYKRVKEYIEGSVLLELKQNCQINRSVNGLTFCGFRIFTNSLRLTKRKKIRYAKRLAQWEKMYADGFIRGNKLQSAYASVHSIVAHADSKGWRKTIFKKREPLEV